MFFLSWQTTDTSFMLCHGLIRRGHAVEREILCHQLSAKQANPDELTQIPWTCNLEAPNPTVHATEQMLYLSWTAPTLVQAGCAQQPMWACHKVGSGHHSQKLIPVTYKWQKSPIWWHKFLQKNLEMQLVWSSKILISKQLKKFQHLLSCCPLKNSSETLANTSKLLITVADESQKYL